VNAIDYEGGAFSTYSPGSSPASTKKSGKRGRRTIKGRRIRPVLLYTKRGWRRPKRSHFKRPFRINPRRRRRYARRYNPKLSIKSLLSKQMLMTGVKIAAGMVAGYLTLPLVYTVLPANMKTAANRKYLGLVNVGVGAILFALMKKKMIKDVGLVIAATGVYDLISQNIPQLGLPVIPTSNILIDKAIPSNASTTATEATHGLYASYGVARLPVSSSAQMMGASAYRTRALYGASYSAPTAKTAGFGCDNPFSQIEGYQD
jgi:hypothetical protein